MSKARVVVSKIISKQMSVSAAAAAYGVSRQHVHRWLARYRDQGLGGLEPRSRRPHANPRRTASEVAERIVALRRELSGQGLAAGPQTIGWHLAREHLAAPSTSTIRRILVAAWLVTAEPRKRPKSSYRFEADQPTSAGNPTSPTGGSPMARRGDHQLARRPFPIPSVRDRPATDHR
jgi:hypothetical protein